MATDYHLFDVLQPVSSSENPGFSAFLIINHTQWAQQPQKVLSFKSPYDAIADIINPSQIITLGELLDKYFAYAKKTRKRTTGNMDFDPGTPLQPSLQLMLGPGLAKVTY